MGLLDYSGQCLSRPTRHTNSETQLHWLICLPHLVLRKKYVKHQRVSPFQAYSLLTILSPVSVSCTAHPSRSRCKSALSWACPTQPRPLPTHIHKQHTRSTPFPFLRTTHFPAVAPGTFCPLVFAPVYRPFDVSSSTQYSSIHSHWRKLGCISIRPALLSLWGFFDLATFTLFQVKCCRNI